MAETRWRACAESFSMGDNPYWYGKWRATARNAAKQAARWASREEQDLAAVWIESEAGEIQEIEVGR